MRVYTVQPGDTLNAIATKHGTTLDWLQDNNPIIEGNPDHIEVGWMLTVPDTDGAPEETPDAPSERPKRKVAGSEQAIALIDARLNGQGQVILEEAQKVGLDLALACALVEQESGGRNIFGADYGPTGDAPPYCNHPVTKARVARLRASRYQNGVGLTQLTYDPFVGRADDMGGAHLPRYQCRAGFDILKDLLDRYKYNEALGAYNAGEQNRRSVLLTYAASLAAKHQNWKVLLAGKTEAPAPDKPAPAAADHTGNFERGVAYFTPAVGKTSYWFWPPALDIVPDGPGAFAVNKPMVPITQVISGGIFCQGVINGFRRLAGKKVPTMGDDRYDGGTWANQNYFADYIEKFSRYEVYPRGTLVGRYFRWAGRPGFSGVLDQGHVAVLMGEQNLAQQKDPLILHSHPAVGGLNYTRLGASHAGWYYEYAIRPEDWINHDKGSF